MAGTISFGGIGSGIDTEGIVTGLVQASSGNLNALKSRASNTRAAVSTLSDIGSLLSKLKTSVEGLASAQDVKGFKTTSSASAVVASANGLATMGSYSVEVLSLAKEQRTYSEKFGSSTDALGQVGVLTFQIGSADPVEIDVNSADSLDAIATRINSKFTEEGVRAAASLFFDGTDYRIQIRGLDTGAAGAVNITDSTSGLGLSTPANTFQQASDAQVKIDGFTVTRPTNQIVGAIPGVTLALTDLTAAPAKITIDSDSSELKTKLQSVVDAYNAVIKKVHTATGFGSTKADNSVLAGDSMLRGLTTRLADGILKTVPGTGEFQTLGSIGMSVNRDGTLTLNTTKLDTALTKDPSSVTTLLAGSSSGDGAMDMLRDMLALFTKTGTGLLNTRSDALSTKVKQLEERATREQTRLNTYADALRKQFTNMDSSVASSNAQLTYLGKITG